VSRGSTVEEACRREEHTRSAVALRAWRGGVGRRGAGDSAPAAPPVSGSVAFSVSSNLSVPFSKILPVGGLKASSTGVLAIVRLSRKKVRPPRASPRASLQYTHPRRRAGPIGLSGDGQAGRRVAAPRHCTCVAGAFTKQVLGASLLLCHVGHDWNESLMTRSKLKPYYLYQLVNFLRGSDSGHLRVARSQPMHRTLNLSLEAAPWLVSVSVWRTHHDATDKMACT